MKDLTVQNIKTADIRAYKNNPKLHTKAQVSKIRESISEFGFINPVLLDENMEIIAGHGRVAAGTYLPARDADSLATDTVVEFLNSDLSTLPDVLNHTLKQIDYGVLDYMARRHLVQVLIRRAIYASDKITFFINTDSESLCRFTRADYINTQCNKIDFIRNGDDLILVRPVVLNK